MTPLESIAGRMTRMEVATSGVYVLIRGDEVLYVGSSSMVTGRVVSHAYAGIPFDHALWIPLPKRSLAAYEGALMRFFDPPYNQRCPALTESDAPILAALGLPPHADEAAVFAYWKTRNGADQKRYADSPKGKAARREEVAARVRRLREAQRTSTPEVSP